MLYAVIQAVRPLFRHLVKAVGSNLEGSGISVAMRGMLERLVEAGPQTVPDLARALLIPRQFAQQIANELRDLGLTEPIINPAHRRSWLISLTPEGTAAFARIRMREQVVVKEAAEGLSAEDLATCLRVLQHLSAHFEAATPAALALPERAGTTGP